MIKPTLSVLHDNLQPGLKQFFQECGWDFATEWKFNPRRTLVALWKGEIVGFVTSWWDDQPIAWIDMLIVTPRLRNKGIGVWLCWTMEALLQQQGATIIRALLEDTEDHRSIRPHLERAGFGKWAEMTVMEKRYNGRQSTESRSCRR